MRVARKYQPVDQRDRPVIIYGGRVNVRIIGEERKDVAVALDSPIWGLGMPRRCIGDHDELILVACGWWNFLLPWGKTITVRVPRNTEVEVRIARRAFTEGDLETPPLIDNATEVE
ncbi:hypothetical protein SAMN06265355_12075 [Actinomadura mexicana]|uniref:Uncharacterized protein n=1 Tax=Actinomadura mexicana TaxID=134959 RepID=A0A239FFE3_9ACTN|nr:hypothetical protein SAMN06265355_12075 [Actinomadura mexicana]